MKWWWPFLFFAFFAGSLFGIWAVSAIGSPQGESAVYVVSEPPWIVSQRWRSVSAPDGGEAVYTELRSSNSSAVVYRPWACHNFTQNASMLCVLFDGWFVPSNFSGRVERWEMKRAASAWSRMDEIRRTARG